jgi:SNF2 family DNA or RNA helicase
LALVEELRDLLPHKAIFWGRFNNDIDLMMDVLGERAVRYDGTVDEDARARAKDDFQKGDAQWFVAKQQSAGEGLTLHAAKTAVYYSNTFRLLDRLQSEDRPHRIGMDDNPVNYIDLIAEDTVDEHIIKNLRLKRDIAATLTGDELGEWI